MPNNTLLQLLKLSSSDEDLFLWLLFPSHWLFTSFCVAVSAWQDSHDSSMQVTFNLLLQNEKFQNSLISTWHCVTVCLQCIMWGACFQCLSRFLLTALNYNLESEKGMFALEKVLKSLEFFVQKSPQTWNPPYSVKRRTNSKVNPCMASIKRETCAVTTAPFIFPSKCTSMWKTHNKTDERVRYQHYPYHNLADINTISFHASIKQLNIQQSYLIDHQTIMYFVTRAITCNHLQCFDAALFLQMNER